jgi:hypothetical protein
LELFLALRTVLPRQEKINTKVAFLSSGNPVVRFESNPQGRGGSSRRGCSQLRWRHLSCSGKTCGFSLWVSWEEDDEDAVAGGEGRLLVYKSGKAEHDEVRQRKINSIYSL